MSNVIALLERIGQDARLRYATSEQLAQALKDVQIDLHTVLESSQVTCCLIHAPESDEEHDGVDEVSAQAA
jgi:hypothetical protein